MNQKVIILAATKYSQVNEETGECKNGLSIEYVGDRLDEKGDTYEKMGYPTFKDSLQDESLIKQVVNIPGVYEISLQMKSTSKDRKPRLVITGVESISKFDMPW